MEPPPPPWASSLAAVLATALLLVTMLRRRRSAATRKYNLPPGPRPWPVIGNLHLIGSLPHRSLHEISARHGPLMSLRFGSVPVVVASSVDAARFVLKTHDAAFIDRPRMASGRYTAYDFSDVVWSPYGAYWRQARKLWQTKLLSARQLRSQEHVRVEELRALLRGLSSPSFAGRAVALKEHLLMLSLNVISRMALGRKYVGDGEDAAGSPVSPGEFRWMVDELFVLNGVLSVGDFIPWLSWLDPQGYVGRMKRLGKMFDRFLEHVLDEHNERRRREGDGFVATDMVDLLLELADDPGLEVPIERDGVKGFTLDLIAGGTDTSAVAVEWAMSELLRHPDVLAKATGELDSVVGHDRLVTEQDIPKLPYLEAIVKETFRLHPVSPLLAPRLARKDASTGSYDVPAGTLVFVNAWAIGRDPAVWGRTAEEFRPERFVGSGVDVKGQDLELLPFGSGRRMCPGYALGLKMVQVTLANLLHAFACRLPDGVAAEELSMEEKFGLSMPRKVPLEVVAEPKLPAHLYAIGP
ncbi:hypothetical protein GQ55_9G468900 [Panicum hallii var. hallii]|uniref:Uncharacterized protein n=1 Tax=Panicum hallii var. hallii TaxID=1504633 RepID=A0A2T7CCD0_9POAL|nr:hypothetical protein GQ55_9G468900 [Panicum hallii var. hallii]